MLKQRGEKRKRQTAAGDAERSAFIPASFSILKNRAPNKLLLADMRIDKILTEVYTDVNKQNVYFRRTGTCPAPKSFLWRRETNHAKETT